MKAKGKGYVWVRLMAAGFAALLLGCAPEYNWRQVAVADGRVVALFPAKPAQERRELPFLGRKVAFTMTQARVDDDWFVVGYASWGDDFRDDAGLRGQFHREVLLSLYRNFGATPPDTLPATGEPFELRGGPERALRVRGRIWLTPHGLLEGLVMTAADGQTDEQAVLFLETLADSVAVPGR